MRLPPSSRSFSLLLTFTLLLLSSPLFGQPSLDREDPIPLRAWTIANFTAPPEAGLITPLTDISGRAAFVAVTPCRVVDTRLAAGPFTGPKLEAAASRSFVVPSGPCPDIPTAAAYSLNITVTQPEANNGFLTGYPSGTVRPLVSNLNFNLNETRGNSAIIPADGFGSIDIYANVKTHVIIDINGYLIEPVLTGVATPLNTPNAVVVRDGAGGFAAGALTLSGKLVQTSDDGFASIGTLSSGTIPATGPGPRMMWYPARGAFRAGVAWGDEWDDGGIGVASIALGYATRANGTYSTALGYGTTASGYNSTAMGLFSEATGFHSTALGYDTTASGAYSTAMGAYTTASGWRSTAMGYYTTASGDFSTAMGHYASTTDLFALPRPGTLVWGDASTTTEVRPTADNQFVARAAGGVTFYSNALMTTGVTLAAGGGSWASVSDRALKTGFAPVDGEQILGKLAALPVTNWSYRDDTSGRRYLGPVAQDFHELFDLGDDTTISTLDVDGVTLASLKALEVRTGALQSENEALRSQIQMLVERINRLESR